MKPVADSLALEGTLVDGRYLVECAVGRGGFGIVYRARHLRFEAPVALKILKPEHTTRRGDRDDVVARFNAEGRLLFELGRQHPGFVQVLEAGSIEMRGSIAPYLVLEWLEGCSLSDALRTRQKLKAEPFSLLEAIEFVDDAADALAFAHASAVVHRDIKPSNVWLGPTGSKLLDLGIAKVISDAVSPDERHQDSAFGRTPFTPAYAAPEQWDRRFGATGPHTDVYSLALVLVELLAGRRALDGENSSQLMAACLNLRFRPTPRSLGVEVSEDTEATFARALTIDPRLRYPDAGSFWNALRAEVGLPPALARRSIPVGLPKLEFTSGGPVTVTVNATGEPTADASQPVASARPRVDRRYALAAGALVAVLGAGVALAWGPAQRGATANAPASFREAAHGSSGDSPERGRVASGPAQGVPAAPAQSPSAPRASAPGSARVPASSSRPAAPPSAAVPAPARASASGELERLLLHRDLSRRY
jgi:serine/threonine-protein kinase